jgi:hypothetical protein
MAVMNAATGLRSNRLARLTSDTRPYNAPTPGTPVPV